ncbi:MAG: ribulose-phosphate 3-epimerase [Candidatus Scalindua sp. AMX11]|nr:MAG: ribulose-phosphate 3-epimerase [Candidatus Scalindua sp.]NOG82220.1 ribulose-phosphate 3-epimerase [Planctomycetota bacterium]RZV65502.1 MAG: ribulose-phosphate 3-epimerase [Candidatus Scalindua sp. SCAELEC01]TDE63382.1 MAG: ribulose-phosphate 3-epimerase [Candidatus Scalindua sp. AMX11]
MQIKIAASILAADPTEFGKELERVEKAGIDLIHIDVMDGHFVPNITMGPFIVEGLKKKSHVPLDIHLMIENPENYIGSFAEKAGKDDVITFHIEATDNPLKVIDIIKQTGLKAGVAISPDTDANSIKSLLNSIDMILVMSVYPGFAGQKFINAVCSKIETLRGAAPVGLDIGVDGGITPETISEAASAGANVFAAATSIFGKRDYSEAIKKLRQVAQDHSNPLIKN